VSPDLNISREIPAWLETGGFDISREMAARLKAYVGLLEDWNARHNLVSQNSLADVWRRHVWDSAQLVRYIPKSAQTLADLGSGAGFPGLVLAVLLQDRVQVTLFESTAKKCRFLETVRDRLGLNSLIRNERMEAATPQPFGVVTARACAPLETLLGYAQNFVRPGSVCLFLKGQNLAVELTQARKSWKIKALEHQSLSDPLGKVLEIREFRHVRDRGPEDRPPARPGRRQPEGRRR
jgi:16S rRNA (guanine527-N7)-methyltransferase